MRRTKTAIAIACLLPLSSCAVLGKAGVKVNGDNVTSPSPSTRPTSHAPAQPQPQPGDPASSTPAPTAFAEPDVAPAPAISDSVTAIPAAMQIAPASGAPVISLLGASWCTDQVKGLDWDGAAERKYTQALKKADSFFISGMEGIRNMARFACGGTKSAARLSWVQSYMQARANATGMNQAHQTHLFRILSTKDADPRNFTNYEPEGCKKFETKGTPNRLVRERSQALRIGMGCKDYGNSDWMVWWMDRGSSIGSHVTAMGWLYTTFGASSKAASLQRGLLALHDANTFNVNAYFSELKSLGADDQIIGKSIVKYYKYKTMFAAWKSHHSEELGEDFTTIVNAANAGFKDWQSSYQANKVAVDFAFKIEEAVLEGDKRKFTGCSELAQKYATTFVMRDNPKTVEEIQRAAAHPVGRLIVAAAYECERGLGKAMAASVYAQMLKEAPTSRGPRFAARLAAVKAVAEIKAVKSRFSLRPRDFVPPSQQGGFGNAGVGHFVTGSGVVAKVKTKGTSLEIQFKKESWKEDVFSCRETRRLDRIDSNGRLVYRKICKKTGTKTITSQEKPITIDTSAGAGIKPGSFLVVARSKGDSSVGLPRRVFKTKKKTTLVNYYGLSLR